MTVPERRRVNRIRGVRGATLVAFVMIQVASLTSAASASPQQWVSHGPGGADVYALAADPSAPKTIYAGTQSDGMFKTTTGGSEWSSIDNGVPPQAWIHGFAIDPSAPQTVYAAELSAGVFPAGC